MVRGPAAHKPNPWDLDKDATWADAVQRYDREKLIAPETPEVLPARQYRDGRTNRKKEERAYDVVTHKWLDQPTEELKSRQEAIALEEHMSKAAKRAIRYESHYDVVNHNRKVGIPEPPPPPPKVERPPSPVPAAGQIEHRDRKAKPSYFWDSSHGRDYHVLSNRYLQKDHDERFAREHQEAKEEAARRFFRTNRYNPVTGTFYDPDEEARFQRDRHIAMHEHGKDIYSRAPPHFDKAEGLVYNILAPQIAKDPDELIRQDAIQRVQESQPRLKAVFEDNLQTRMDQLVQSQVSRAMNRTSEKRYQDTVDKGYNILTNQPFKGRLGRPYAAAYKRQNIPPPEPYYGLDYSGQQAAKERERTQQLQQQPQQQSPYTSNPNSKPQSPQYRPASNQSQGRPRSRPGSQEQRQVQFAEEQQYYEYANSQDQYGQPVNIHEQMARQYQQ